eukprot:327772-Hanusia_phi.AAC.5
MARKGGVVSKARNGIRSKHPCYDGQFAIESKATFSLTVTNVQVKVIVGGVAPLLMPWCIKNQGLLGGTLTVRSGVVKLSV